MKMTGGTATTLMWLSLVLLVVAGMVGSPGAGVFAAAISAICAIAPVVFGSKAVRIAGALIMLAAVALGWSLSPSAGTHSDAYRERARR